MKNIHFLISFQDATEIIEILFGELVTYLNNFMTRLMNCEVVNMIHTNVKLLIKANPNIINMCKVLYEADLVALLENVYIGKFIRM